MPILARVQHSPTWLVHISQGLKYNAAGHCGAESKRAHLVRWKRLLHRSRTHYCGYSGLNMPNAVYTLGTERAEWVAWPVQRLKRARFGVVVPVLPSYS